MGEAGSEFEEWMLGWGNIIANSNKKLVCFPLASLAIMAWSGHKVQLFLHLES